LANQNLKKIRRHLQETLVQFSPSLLVDSRNTLADIAGLAFSQGKDSSTNPAKTRIGAIGIDIQTGTHRGFGGLALSIQHAGGDAPPGDFSVVERGGGLFEYLISGLKKVQSSGSIAQNKSGPVLRTAEYSLLLLHSLYHACELMTMRF
jgi:hypothetical protein